MVFEDRILKNPRLLRLKNSETGEIVDWEIQDLKPSEIEQEGTEINAELLNDLLNNSYLLGEKKTNMVWVDGKDIYRKVLFITELDNDNINTTISHNIQNLEHVTDVRGVVTFEQGQVKGQRMLPCIHGSGGEDYIFSAYDISDTEITITTGAWWRSGVFKEAYIILEYTKKEG